MMTIDEWLKQAEQNVSMFNAKPYDGSFPCWGIVCNECPFSTSFAVRRGQGNGECDANKRASEASLALFKKYHWSKKLELI